MEFRFSKLLSKSIVLLRNEEAQDLMEYALAFGIIAFGAAAAMSPIADHVATAFNLVGNVITSTIT